MSFHCMSFISSLVNFENTKPYIQSRGIFFASHVTTLQAINLSLVKHDSTSCSISQVGKFNIPALHVHNIWTPFNLFLSQALRFSSPSDTSACEEPLQIFLLYNWIASQHVILLYTLQITIYIYCLQIWMSLYTL